MNPIIRSDGSPRFAMVSTLAGAIANIILDPIFIYIFKWGMMGAAVATVLGQILTAGLAVWYLLHMKAVKLEKSSFKPDRHLIPRFLSLGMTSFLAQISLVISLMREIFFGVFLPILMPVFMGWDGLLWSFPAADVLTFVIALLFIVGTYRRLSE